MAAEKVDPRSVFDAFGTASFLAEEGKHPPGKLNDMLSVGVKPEEKPLAKSIILLSKPTQEPKS